MDVATDPWLLHSKESRAKVIENMEFDSEGERLISRRGLGSPLYTFPADILYIWYDYGLNNYIVFLKNKNVYTYEFGKTPTYGSSNPVTSAGIRVYVDGKIPTKMSQLTNDSEYGKYIKYSVTTTSSSVVSSTTHSSDGFGYSFSLGYRGCTSDWYAGIVFPSTFKDPYWLETGTNIINVYFISKPSSTLNCTLILIHG